MSDYHPRNSDHLPRTRRGHGIMRNGKCCNPLCVINNKGKGEEHTGTIKSNNRTDWEEEHGAPFPRD
jgi:hypothetical protein